MTTPRTHAASLADQSDRSENGTDPLTGEGWCQRERLARNVKQFGASGHGLDRANP